MTEQATMHDVNEQNKILADKYRKLLEKSRKSSKAARAKRKKEGLKDFSLISFDLDRKAMKMPDNIKAFVCYADEKYIANLKRNNKIACIVTDNNAIKVNIIDAKCRTGVKTNENNSVSVQSTEAKLEQPEKNTQTHIQNNAIREPTTHKQQSDTK